MTIYYDMSAAVHGDPGLGRYAESLGRALLQAHGESMSLFYYGPTGIQPPRGLEDVSMMPHLTAALSARGVDDETLERILSKNALRVLQDVPPRL